MRALSGVSVLKTKLCMPSSPTEAGLVVHAYGRWASQSVLMPIQPTWSRWVTLVTESLTGSRVKSAPSRRYVLRWVVMAFMALLVVGMRYGGE